MKDYQFSVQRATGRNSLLHCTSFSYSWLNQSRTQHRLCICGLLADQAHDMHSQLQIRILFLGKLVIPEHLLELPLCHPVVRYYKITKTNVIFFSKNVIAWYKQYKQNVISDIQSPPTSISTEGKRIFEFRSGQSNQNPCQSGLRQNAQSPF